jgi:hypothetical protein
MSETVICERCGGTWIDGRLIWATGAPGKELDLAGLVCNVVNDDRCINPQKGREGGQTFQSRLGYAGADDVN